MKRLLILATLLISLLALTACTAATVEPVTPTASQSLITTTPSDTPTPSPHPIITVRPTFTPKPSTTPYPTVEFAVPPLQSANYNGPVPAGAIARLGKGNIKAMALTPDKQYLIVGGNIGLYAYRVEDFQEIWASPVSSEVRCITISPVDSTLVTGMVDGSIMAWNGDTGSMLFTMNGSHDNIITQIVYNSSGTMIASVSNDSIVMIWDAQTGERLQTLDPGHELIRELAWLPGEDKLMIGSSFVTIWDVTNTEFTFNSAEYDQYLQGFVFAPDETLLIGLDNRCGCSITLREASSGEVVHELSGYIASTMRGTVATGVSPDNSILAIGGGNGMITLWDLTTGQRLSALSGHIDEIVSLEFGQDSNTLYSSAEDGQIIEWDTQTGKPIRAIRDHSPLVRRVSALAWSPDNTTLAYAYGGMPHLTYPDEKLAAVYDTVLLWDRTDQTYTTFPAQIGLVDITSLAYSPDGLWLAAGPHYGPVIVWGVETIQQQITSLGVEYCIAFSGDGELLASGMGTAVGIGDGHTGELLRRLDQVSLPGTYDLEFSIDNTRLFVGSGRGIFVINAVSGEMVDQFDTQDETVHSVALSPDGTKLVAGLNNGSIVVWDIKTGTRLFELNGHARNVGSLDWSPDGRFILSGSDDSLAIVWDAQTGEQLYLLNGHASAIASVAWSPDMRYIATGSHDGTVVIWEAQ